MLHGKSSQNTAPISTGSQKLSLLHRKFSQDTAPSSRTHSDPVADNNCNAHENANRYNIYTEIECGSIENSDNEQNNGNAAEQGRKTEDYYSSFESEEGTSGEKEAVSEEEYEKSENERININEDDIDDSDASDDHHEPDDLRSQSNSSPDEQIQECKKSTLKVVLPSVVTNEEENIVKINGNYRQVETVLKKNRKLIQWQSESSSDIHTATPSLHSSEPVLGEILC